MTGDQPYLSVCIASYGDDVSPLLSGLDEARKGLLEQWPCEIIISDQYPESHEKKNLWQAYADCQYLHQPHTKGRSINRNGLGNVARGEYLLFLDADSECPDDQFLYRYCSASKNAEVVVGGTAYKSGFKTSELRVRIGKRKEEKSSVQRGSNPYGSFSAFNFLIKKNTFNAVGFDESLRTYGHEDTLFGLELKYRNITITHIDNPAYHMGIDSGADFMDKTTAAVDGLAHLISIGKIDEDVRLFKTYRSVQKSGFQLFFKVLYRLFGAPLKSGLANGFVPLFFYDVYKLLRLCNHSIKIGRRMP